MTKVPTRADHVMTVRHPQPAQPAGANDPRISEAAATRCPAIGSVGSGLATVSWLEIPGQVLDELVPLFVGEIAEQRCPEASVVG
jgi:hypothetical protein